MARDGKLSSAMQVGFADARSHPLRDELLEVAFAARATALDASRRVAQRLAGAMDNRSKPCLLVLSQHKVPAAGERRVLLSMFARDEVLRRAASSVELLDDVFSLTSRYRKAALVDGPRDHTGFLTAKVVDQQSTGADRSAADFWIERFLLAVPLMNSREGTVALGQVITKTLRSLQGDVAALDQVMAAVGVLRTGPRRRRSMQSIALDLLDGTARNAFSAAAGDGPETRAAFDIDVDRLDAQLQYRIFDLPEGVKISAPMAVVSSDTGAAVRQWEAGGVRHVSAGGPVESERVARRG